MSWLKLLLLLQGVRIRSLGPKWLSPACVCHRSAIGDGGPSLADLSSPSFALPMYET